MARGMGNLGNIMKQAKKMAERMQEIDTVLAEKTVDASAGGGMVTAVANGQGHLVSVTIDPEVVDPEDVEMLQDLILAAANEALRKALELKAEEMQKITGGINIPGLT